MTDRISEVFKFIRTVPEPPRLFMSKHLVEEFIEKSNDEGGTAALFGIRMKVVPNVPDDLALMIGADGSVVLLDMRHECAKSKKPSTKSSPSSTGRRSSSPPRWRPSPPRS